MKYALNLAEDGRVLSITTAEFGPTESEKVDEFPEGNIYEYRYVDGGFVYDPIPKTATPPSDSDRIAALEMAMLEMMGVSLID